MSDEPSLDWIDGAPRSRRFDDVYFSAVDGLSESRAVFLAGCGLPEAWAGRSRFTVGELGFGTGLNVLALLDLWRRARPPEGRLHVFSVEGFPLTPEEAARALAAWPELAGLAEPLLARWPRRPGFHRIDWPGLGAVLDLAIGEAGEMLAAWSGRADAWFLDGFAPARNPEMWRQELLDLVAARSAPGGRAATFTVAGAVRRGLEAAGFAVAKRPGFGRKRERLEAVISGALETSATPRVAIVGAGIAGAALARAFRALGAEPQVVDAEGAGAGASGNPSALVSPRLDAGGGVVSALHAQAYDRAVQLYEAEAPAAILARGALQLEAAPRDAARFDRVAAWEGFAPGAVQRLAPEAAAEMLDEHAGPGGLEFPGALTVAPRAILEPWLGPVVPAAIAAVEARDGAWALLDRHWNEILVADVVCLAAGPSSAKLAGLGPLRAVRGQVSVAAGLAPGTAAAWGGYAIAAPGGLLFGATHDRDDWDVSVRPEDHQRNLVALAKGRPRLAARVDPARLQGRASLRAATPDHLPLAGALGSGLFVLSGLGGRGFTLAPLLAEEVAAMALSAPRPLPRELAAAVDPGRYAE